MKTRKYYRNKIDETRNKIHFFANIIDNYWSSEWYYKFNMLGRLREIKFDKKFINKLLWELEIEIYGMISWDEKFSSQKKLIETIEAAKENDIFINWVSISRHQNFDKNFIDKYENNLYWTSYGELNKKLSPELWGHFLKAEWNKELKMIGKQKKW